MHIIIYSYLNTTKIKGFRRLNQNKWHDSLARSDLWSYVCVEKIVKRGTTKFEIHKYNGKNFSMCKVRMHAILVENGYAITLKGKTLKPQRCTV